jgi:hypothetical protein
MAEYYTPDTKIYASSNNAQPAIALCPVTMEEALPDEREAEKPKVEEQAEEEPFYLQIFTLDNRPACKKGENGECQCEMDEDSVEELCEAVTEKIAHHLNDMLVTSLAVILAKKRLNVLDEDEFKEYDQAAVAYTKWLMKLSAKCEEKMEKNSK